MLDETVPIQLSSTFGTATNTFLSGGIMVALLLGIGLPDDDDIEGQKETGFWRVIYGFQYFCQALTVIMFMTCYPEDSITYSISTENDEASLVLIIKVVSNKDHRLSVVSTGLEHAPITLAYFGRKQLLFWGQLSMVLSL